MSEEIRLAFLAGFAAGFDSSGEGFNGEYAPRLTTERFAGLSERAFMEWLDDSASRNEYGVPTVWCDPCLAPLVTALNSAGLRTIASCCGHGRRPSVVTLAGGRELVVLTTEQREAMDLQFPDINADPADRVHIYPTAGRAHTPNDDCWCKPRPNAGDHGVIVHRYGVD